MFSFFKSKKPSPSSSPESEPIGSGPASGTDFVVVEKRDPTQPGLYPSFDPSRTPYGYPTRSHLPAAPSTQPTTTTTSSDNTQNTNYLHGVPFKLSSELTATDSSEITKIQIDDILTMITSRMHMPKPDYDFALERSTIAQNSTDWNGGLFYQFK